MKRRFVGLISLILSVLCLGGCSVSFTSVEDLVRPPKLSGEYALLQKSLETAEKGKIGTDIIMKYVESGTYGRTSYIFYDLDSDGKNEAITFYSLKTDKTADKDSVLMRIFYREEEEWRALDPIEGYGASVFSIDFADLNNDGYSGILVMWDVYESKSKILSVFSAMNTGNEKIYIKEFAKELCNTVDCVDIDSDGSIDIFTTYIDLSVEHPKAYAKVLTLDGKDKIVSLGETEIDATVLSYTSVKVENSAADKPVRIFLDAPKGENQMITEVIYWDSQKQQLCTVFFDKKTFMTTKSLRSIRVGSFDIDNDGLIEIPLPANVSNNTNIIAWNELNIKNNDISFKKYTAVSSNLDFMVDFKNSWKDLVDVSFDLENTKMSFYYSSLKNNSESGEELFSILKFDPANENNLIPENYILCFKDSKSGYEYYFNITKAGENFGITKESIKLTIL